MITSALVLRHSIQQRINKVHLDSAKLLTTFDYNFLLKFQLSLSKFSKLHLENPVILILNLNFLVAQVY